MQTGEQCPQCGNDYDPMHACGCRLKGDARFDHDRAWARNVIMRGGATTELPFSLEINGKVYVEARAEILAKAVADLDSEKQAAFLDSLAALSAAWSRSRRIQWSYVAEKLSQRARGMIEEWSEYFLADQTVQ